MGEAQHHSSRTIEELFEMVDSEGRETDDFESTGYPSEMVVELWEIREIRELGDGVTVLMHPVTPSLTFIHLRVDNIGRTLVVEKIEQTVEGHLLHAQAAVIGEGCGVGGGDDAGMIAKA